MIKISKSQSSNPLFMYFLIFAVLCCLILSSFFIYLYMENRQQQQDLYYQEKVSAVAADLEAQIESFKNLALQLGINPLYNPANKSSKYSEISLLHHFHETYGYYSVLTKDFFLYYPENLQLFHIKGKLIGLDVYLSELSSDDKDLILLELNNPEDRWNFIRVGNDLYFLVPVRFSATDVSLTLLGGRIKNTDLKQRIQFINGNIGGEWFIYESNRLLYSSNNDTPADPPSTYASSLFEDRFTIYYIPGVRLHKNTKAIFMPALIFLLDCGMIILMIYLYSNKAGESYRLVNEKYQNDCQILEEQQKRQLLRAVLNGSVVMSRESVIGKLGSLLPGPFYYVISIACEGSEESFLLMLQKRLEQASFSLRGATIYAICEFEEKQLWIIVSIVQEDFENTITKFITDMVNELYGEVIQGIGKVYNQIDRISASWLESQDNLMMSLRRKKTGQNAFTYTPKLFQNVISAIAIRDREAAIKNLAVFASEIQEQAISFLMRQYIFMDFISEIKFVAKQYNFEPTNRQISLIVSSQNMDRFYEAASELICDLFDRIYSDVDLRKKQEMENICNYIEDHFMEYDLSIEKVAEKTGTALPLVRKAVFDNRGKLYRDYIIDLRISYAKELLAEGKLSVADISEKVGYSSVSYFIKVFKISVGVTPAKYMRDFSG